MREFGERFMKGLKQGLRPHGNSVPGTEQLIECFNLQPTEEGLRGRDDVVLIDSSLQFTYFCLQSEVGDVWCIYIDSAGQIVTNYGPPDQIDGFAPGDTSLDPLPRFVQMSAANEPGLELYMYPDVTGSLTVDYASPGGDGYEADYLSLDSPNGYRYNLVVINTLETLARQLS